ncbi:MAG: hypothetical protein COV29_03645 [Candidatus Yanofskybacteria bacterium CG10_big_fil_rev_8_21_14_0_10_36_16]|uniref:Uncharacterized protein n=1 Tax=Candidatus Yanofskybacteria bacterium CG10_big_fil_rev_8_21_14_0_10_36_16 TaxID=1975096 RepID=A0A2J0Q6J4_9BACT|nr:MAG: hypothetical protein COV29_03645 [Candidatus Yanofskybacteria bacterium CG10_big_fil_rev_8_21_14_0_10_36_16]
MLTATVLELVQSRADTPSPVYIIPPRSIVDAATIDAEAYLEYVKAGSLVTPAFVTLKQYEAPPVADVVA